MHHPNKKRHAITQVRLLPIRASTTTDYVGFYNVPMGGREYPKQDKALSLCELVLLCKHILNLATAQCSGIQRVRIRVKIKKKPTLVMALCQ
jgi:hypothetical protein